MRSGGVEMSSGEAAIARFQMLVNAVLDGGVVMMNYGKERPDYVMCAVYVDHDNKTMYIPLARLLGHAPGQPMEEPV